MTKQLVLTVGLPASGKSTFAKKWVKEGPNRVRVNRDSLRLMIHGEAFDYKFEDDVTDAEFACIKAFINLGKDIIVDECNINPKTREHLRAIAAQYNYEFVIKDFMHVSVEECIKRDSHRSTPVGKDVIERFYYQYWEKQTKPANEGQELAIICDIDGTIAHSPDKNFKHGRDVSKDIIDPAVQMILDSMNIFGYETLFVSGREDRDRAATEAWLNKYHLIYDKLWMRPTGNNDNDKIIKKDIYMKHIQGKYKVLFVLDDRPRLVRMWRAELGLKCLQVGPNIEF